MHLTSSLKSIRAIRVETAVKLISYAIAFVGFISVALELQYVYGVLFVLVMAISVYLDYSNGADGQDAWYVPRWVVNALSVAVIVLSIFRMYGDDFVEPAVEALLILLSIKFLERRRFRDYMQIYLISMFLLAGAALLSIDLSFFLYFIVFFFLISSAIVLLTYYSQVPELLIRRDIFIKIVFKTMVIPLLAIPMSSIIFLVLPRTDYPFFSFLNRSGKGRSGFADSVTLGGVSSIQQDSSVVFRATMDKVEDDRLYWRGILLDVFDGASWKSSFAAAPMSSQAVPPPPPRGRTITQTIYLEPYGNRYLFALDKPVSVFLKHVRAPGGFVYLAKEPIKGKVRYDAVSVVDDGQMDTKHQPPDLDKYLKLPDDIPPEIVTLARSLTKDKDQKASAEGISAYLGSGSYKYTLDNLPTSPSPLNEFLFKTKAGNCEYFASSMAVMLRSVGIAANVVGGYKGGQYNTIGGYYLIVQKNAHVWVEAYIRDDKQAAGRWVRYDPTPAAGFSLDIETRGGFLKSLKASFDALDYYWSVFVINYNFDRQLTLFKKLRTNIKIPKFKSPLLTGRFKQSSTTAVAVASVILLLAIALSRIYINKTPEELKLLDSFRRKLQKAGFMKRRWEGLEEFVASITDDDLRGQAAAFAVEFERLYYRDERFTKDHIRRLKAVVKAIRPTSKP